MTTENIAALRAENDYLREAMRQAIAILGFGCTLEMFHANTEARKTLEFGLTHAGNSEKVKDA